MALDKNFNEIQIRFFMKYPKINELSVTYELNLNPNQTSRKHSRTHDFLMGL